jgi:hypothetical protein
MDGDGIAIYSLIISTFLILSCGIGVFPKKADLNTVSCRPPIISEFFKCSMMISSSQITKSQIADFSDFG